MVKDKYTDFFFIFYLEIINQVTDLRYVHSTKTNNIIHFSRDCHPPSLIFSSVHGD